jgi:hypothetical protein
MRRYWGLLERYNCFEGCCSVQAWSSEMRTLWNGMVDNCKALICKMIPIAEGNNADISRRQPNGVLGAWVEVVARDTSAAFTCKYESHYYPW